MAEKIKYVVPVQVANFKKQIMTVVFKRRVDRQFHILTRVLQCSTDLLRQRQQTVIFGNIDPDGSLYRRNVLQCFFHCPTSWSRCEQEYSIDVIGPCNGGLQCE